MRVFSVFLDLCLEIGAEYAILSENNQSLLIMFRMVYIVPSVVAAVVMGNQAEAQSGRFPDDPMVLLVAEVGESPDEEGGNIVEEDAAGATEENIATRCLMAQLSIVQGLIEHLSSDLVAAVPEEVAEELQELLVEARSLENMAIDIGAGEYEELLAEVLQDPAVYSLFSRLEEVTATLDEKAYYNCPALEEVVSQILNILSDLQ